MNLNKSIDLLIDNSGQSASSLQSMIMAYRLFNPSDGNLTTGELPFDSNHAFEQVLALLNGTMANMATTAAVISPNDDNSTIRSINRLVEVSYLSRIIMVTIYLLTAVIAFVVNFFALLILFYGRRKSRQLNRFLSNLGFSDIIFAIFNIPFTYITLIYNTWWLPEFLCPFTSFIQVLAPTVAFYTLIAIGIGRYYVIVTGRECHFLTKSTKFVICIIWLFAVLVALPNLFVSQIKPVLFQNVSYVECTEDWSFVAGKFDNQMAGTIYTIIVFVLTFILPVVALTYLYGRIGIIVYKHQLPVGNDNRVTNQNLTQTKIKVVKMLLLLVISFIVCWSPVQISYLILWVFEDIRRDTGGEEGDGGEPGDSNATSYYSIIYYSMYFIFHWLSCSHTIINPFIYCFFSNNFQKNELIDILCCKVGSNDPRRKSINHCTSVANNNSNFVHNHPNSNSNVNINNNSKQPPTNLIQSNHDNFSHRENARKSQARKLPPNFQSVVTLKDSINDNDNNNNRSSSDSSSPNLV